MVREQPDAVDDSEPKPAPAPELCYLWPCNLPTWLLWLRLQSQWRRGAMGERTGLDYASVLAYLRDIAPSKTKERQAQFAGLQAMEFAALRVWDEQRAMQ